MATLTETAIRNAKAGDKPQKLFDGDGLFLLVTPTGSKLWRFKYRFNGREKLLSFGAYPEIPLKVARERLAAARSQVAQDIDPSAKRKSEKLAREDTFKAISLEWLEQQQRKMSPGTYDKARWMLEDLMFPYIGSLSVKDITAKEILDALRRIEKRGRHETAHRTKQRVTQVFKFAIATDRAIRDPSEALRGALAPTVTTHRAAITQPKLVGALLRAIDDYNGQPVSEIALKLAPILFVRPGELRLARWEEFDIESKEPLWRIPAEKMKMGIEHLVPLPRQAVELLRYLHAQTGPNGLLFPSLRSGARPISENTLNAALRRIGYTKDQMTTHGFRAMARTLLDEELHFRPDYIEHQLAHAVRDPNGRAYNRTAHLPERREMMQGWADYLDKLRVSALDAPSNKDR